MQACQKVGVDLGWRCNAHCPFCFYARDPHLRTPQDTPIEDIYAKIEKARAGGLTQCVIVGYGEPTLSPHFLPVVDHCREQNMPVSVITNGTTGLKRYEEFFDHGGDHLHISSHGMGDTLDGIMGINGAFKKQAELKTWLMANDLPFRTNVTMMQQNYRELVELAAYEISMGVKHFVFLGFIPIYEWSTDRQRVHDIGVHPAALRQQIEPAARLLLEAGVYIDIRYVPYCHIHPDLWPYVTNARHVFVSTFEWNYELQSTNLPSLWDASKRIGDGLAVKGRPCSLCNAYRHCGGWNAKYAAAFGGADLHAITEVPKQYQEVWDKECGMHDLNPVNQHSGILRA